MEEVNDLIPHIEDGVESDSSYNGDGKRSMPFDHNAQLVYDKDSTQQPAFIPPLMALNVHVDANGSDIRRIQDQDFRADDRDEREVWQSNPFSANPFAANNAAANRLPPSLLNISIDPPDSMAANNNKWDPQNRRSDGFRNRSRSRRDSEGRRISRFDNNGENRNRRSSADRTSNSGATGSGPSVDVDGNGATGGGGGNGNGNGNSNSGNGGGRHRTGRSKRRN